MNDAELQTLIKLLKNNKLYFHKTSLGVFGCRLLVHSCAECLLEESGMYCYKRITTA